MAAEIGTGFSSRGRTARSASIAARSLAENGQGLTLQSACRGVHANKFELVRASAQPRPSRDRPCILSRKLVSARRVMIPLHDARRAHDNRSQRIKVSVTGSVYMSYSTEAAAAFNLDDTNVAYKAKGFVTIPMTFVIAKKLGLRFSSCPVGNR